MVKTNQTDTFLFISQYKPYDMTSQGVTNANTLNKQPAKS